MLVCARCYCWVQMQYRVLGALVLMLAGAEYVLRLADAGCCWLVLGAAGWC